MHSQITRSLPTAHFCSLDKVQLLYVGKMQGSMELQLVAGQHVRERDA